MAIKTDSKQKLINYLKIANQEKKSGRLHIYIRDEKNKITSIHLAFGNNDILLCRYGNFSGPDALAFIFTHQIERVHPFPWEVPSRGKNLPLMSIKHFIKKLIGENFIERGHADEVLSESALQSEAQEILAQFYGDQAATSKVREIAQKFDPQKMPEQFINECQTYATLTLGLAASEKFIHLKNTFC